VSFWQLAKLASGATLELPHGPHEATLHVAGQPCAAGSLVRLRGAIAHAGAYAAQRDSIR
jgi:hypothetical protein